MAKRNTGEEQEGSWETWIFIEAGEEEQEKTGMVKLQTWKLVLPVEHRLQLSM